MEVHYCLKIDVGTAKRLDDCNGMFIDTTGPIWDLNMRRKP